MDRIGVRELRNQASQVVRRAKAGERLIITVDGRAAAQIGPLSPSERTADLQELLASGAVVAPRTHAPPDPPRPIRAAGAGRSSTDVLHRLRER
jgi:prevent-host-death family protein